MGEEEISEEEAIDRVRRAMAGQPTNLRNGTVQARPRRGAASRSANSSVSRLKLFSIGSFKEIGKGPKPTEALVIDFLAQCTARPERRTAAEWLKPGRLAAAGPVEFMARIEDSLDDPAYRDLASSIATGTCVLYRRSAGAAGGLRARGSPPTSPSSAGGEGLEPSFHKGLRAPRPGGRGSRAACLLERRPRVGGCPGARKDHSPGCASLWRMADGTSLQHLPACRPQCPRRTGLKPRSTLRKNASFFLLKLDPFVINRTRQAARG